MKFDAYGATLRGDLDPRTVAGILADSMDGIVCKGKAIRRFGDTLSVDVGNRMAAWVGLDQTTGHICIEGKGETSPALAECIRATFPGHTSFRLDVCEDYDEPGAFERLQAVIRHSKGVRVKAGYVALPDDVDDGKTWSVGKRGGVGYLRLYEAGKHPDRLYLNRPDWARAELECRPHYAADKAVAARMSPVEVWGLSAWTKSVGEALMQSPVPRYEPELRKYSHDKTVYYVATKFRRMFETMMDDGLHLESTLRQIWAENDELKRRHML
jgi:hypothetical protein